jgi:hypothetical protein
VVGGAASGGGHARGKRKFFGENGMLALIVGTTVVGHLNCAERMKGYAEIFEEILEGAM